MCTSDGNGRVVDAELVELERGQPVPETLVHLALELREYQYGSFAIVGSHGFSVLDFGFLHFFLLLLSKIPSWLFKNKKGLVASLRLVRFGCNIDGKWQPSLAKWK